MKVMINEVITSTIEVMGLKDECLHQIQIALVELQQLSVEWISPERLTKSKGKTVGWKGTDYLASARVMKLLISHVKEAIEEEGGDDLEKNLEGYQILEEFVLLAQSMVSRIMCDSCNKEEICELELYNKLFLSWSKKYCCEVQEKGLKLTFTSTKGNFLSLMNLPRQMCRFGPMRRYWDSDYEKFISYVKEILPGGIHREGAATLVAKLRRFKETVAVNASKNDAMAFLEKKGLLVDRKDYTRYKDVHVYKSRKEVEEKMEQMKPLSGILVEPEDGSPQYIQVAYRVHGLKKSGDATVFGDLDDGIKRQPINCVSIRFKDGDGKWVASAYYAPTKIVKNQSYENCHIIVETLVDTAAKYVCIVPKLEIHRETRNWVAQLYNVVANDWTERVENNIFVTSSLHQSVFPRS